MHLWTFQPFQFSKSLNPTEIILTDKPVQYPIQYIEMDIGKVEGW